MKRYHLCIPPVASVAGCEARFGGSLRFRVLPARAALRALPRSRPQSSAIDGAPRSARSAARWCVAAHARESSSDRGVPARPRPGNGAATSRSCARSRRRRRPPPRALPLNPLDRQAAAVRTGPRVSVQLHPDLLLGAGGLAAPASKETRMEQRSQELHLGSINAPSSWPESR